MRFVRSLLLAACTFCVFACATAAPALDDARPIIVCFGDSLTAGYGVEPGHAYPDYLQALLDRQHLAYRVVNAGVSGNTTKDGLARLDDILRLKPRIAVVEFGGNDGLRGLPIEQTQTNLTDIVSRLQAAHIRVAIAGITLPPQYGHAYISRFDSMYPALARRFHVPYIPFLLAGVYGVQGSMQDDATHATAQGNQVVAANVNELIRPLLKR